MGRLGLNPRVIDCPKTPPSTASFSDPSLISYPNVTGSISEKLNQRNMLITSELSRTLAQQFRQQYEHATTLAKQGK